MDKYAAMFSSVAVAAEFHPRAKTIQFWHRSRDHALCAKVIYQTQKPLQSQEQLEADIAIIATMLGRAAIPDFHAFCSDIEAIFAGAPPSGPIARIQELDWVKFRRISSYSQYWKTRNPYEVSKLLSFMMAMPLYSCLFGQFITQSSSSTVSEIIEQTEHPGGVYIIGVDRFNELFTDEFNHAVNEAKLLVSTFRGTRTDNAAKIVNGMLNRMILL